MSVSIMDVLSLAGSAISLQNPVTTIGDVEDLEQDYQQIKASGKFDLSVIIKKGQLEPFLGELARTTALLHKISQNPADLSRLEAVLAKI